MKNLLFYFIYYCIAIVRQLYHTVLDFFVLLRQDEKAFHYKMREKLNSITTNEESTTTNQYSYVIYIHGLKGSPSRAIQFMKKLEIQNPNSIILMPRIPNRANMALDKSVEFVKSFLLEKIQKPKQIIFICYSLGCVIGKEIKGMDLFPKVDCHFFYIGGPLLGTKLMDWLPVSLFNIHADVLPTLKWKNIELQKQTKQQEEQLMKNIEEEKHSIKKERKDELNEYFIASDYDDRVFPLRTSLGSISQRNIVVTEACTHYSLIHYAFPHVLEQIKLINNQ